LESSRGTAPPARRSPKPDIPVILVVLSRERRSDPGIARADDPIVNSKQAPAVLAIFLATQILDGMLTYWGVSRFGVHIEFNTWLATLMNAIGPAPALLAAKALACLCGMVLFATTSFRILAVATGWCLGFAVVPWVALAIAFA
jgi:hypothetical protein